MTVLLTLLCTFDMVLHMYIMPSLHSSAAKYKNSALPTVIGCGTNRLYIQSEYNISCTQPLASLSSTSINATSNWGSQPSTLFPFLSLYKLKTECFVHVSTARYTGTKPCCQLVVQLTCSLHVHAVFAVNGKAFKKSRSSVLENIKVQNILTCSLKRAHLFRGAVR